MDSDLYGADENGVIPYAVEVEKPDKTIPPDWPYKYAKPCSILDPWDYYCWDDDDEGYFEDVPEKF